MQAGLSLEYQASTLAALCATLGYGSADWFRQPCLIYLLFSAVSIVLTLMSEVSYVPGVFPGQSRQAAYKLAHLSREKLAVDLDGLCKRLLGIFSVSMVVQLTRESSPDKVSSKAGWWIK